MAADGSCPARCPQLGLCLPCSRSLPVSQALALEGSPGRLLLPGSEQGAAGYGLWDTNPTALTCCECWAEVCIG